MNRVLRALTFMLGVSGIMAFVGFLFGFPPSIQNGILLGIVLSVLNAAANFISLDWSFQKSSKVFFSVWSAGVFTRLLVLAATAYAIYGNPSFDFLSTLLTLIFTTMLLMFLEFDFLPKRAA